MSRNEESDKTVKRSNWDSLLPAAVRYDSRLKGDAKILYSEILLLSNKAGYCYATDQHLAALFSKTRVTINGYVKSLEKHGYIKIETTRQGKRVTERRIYPLELPKTSIFQNDKSVISRDSATGSKETLTTYGGSKENLTRGSKETLTTGSKKIFTVNDSNSNDSKKELEREQEGQQPAAGILYNGLTWYESLGNLDGRLKLLMDKYLTSLPVNVIQYAIDKAANKDNVKSSYAYLSRVLADYQENNINTLDELEKLNADRYKQLGMNQLKESDKKQLAANDLEERSKLSLANEKPKTQSISEWQKEQRLKDQQRAISQSETDNRLPDETDNRLPEWLDPKLKAAELKGKGDQSSSLDDKTNNDNQQTGTQPQQEQIKVKDDQPAKPNREPRMNQQEQINVALGLAALRKGKQLSSYQISLIERFDDNEKDLTLLKAYKAKNTSPTTNQG
ncbi:helix-turn-helix domain-containing protein [Limosilactobacillus mucosae]|uniref:helix-turn-helix domain-containing protein n=1 Tax=Limosilactobacillus mucosae TaxID=97478 RepID=UPI0015D52A2D|nr:helix-turn-helix domain-containing protein [Limosilactobacillus mucosae]QLI94856.1 helix-turn-helix domain-containing protein [Limosilactobacillus mucosae]